MRDTLVVGAVVLLGFACQPGTSTLSQERRGEVADSQRQLAIRLAETWNAGDQEAYFDCCLADSTFTVAAGGNRGGAAFADTVRMRLAELARSAATYDRMYVDVLNHDLGVVMTTFQWSAVDTSGTLHQLHDRYTTPISRTAGGLKFINVAESFPPAGT